MELGKLLDSLCFIDEINLSLYNYPDKDGSSSIEPKMNIDFKLRPYQHQLETIEYGITHNR